jgi:hypothetical protein
MDQGSPSLPKATEGRAESADQLQAIAQALEEAGYSEAAQFAFKAAANLDLADAELQRCWGGPMNGQQGRAEAFLALAAAVDAAAIVETGTFRGTTTEWIASHLSASIYTCEIDPRLYYQAREKLSVFGHVTCALQDSRAFIRELAPTLPQDQAVLFYLDAHWNDDLPLTKEIDLILGGVPKAVTVVDDFAVPFDEGYAYDDYGPGKRLTLELLSKTEARDARIFFPSLPSQAETGAKRGCCVIVKAPEIAAKVAALPHFRSADWREWRIVELAGELERERHMASAETERLKRALAEGNDHRDRAREELGAREQDLAHRDAQLLVLQARLESQTKAREDVAAQLRVMKAYCGIIE